MNVTTERAITELFCHDGTGSYCCLSHIKSLFQVLPLNYTAVMAAWDDMRQNQFIDLQTRLMLIDFNMYNAALNSMHI